MTVEELLNQLESEKTKSQALVNMYERNFYDCVKRNDRKYHTQPGCLCTSHYKKCAYK